MYLQDQSIQKIINLILKKTSLPVSSASFLAEISVRSPRKLFIFIILKNIFWLKVSKNCFI